MSDITDKFGNPIKEGDHVIYTSYGDMYLGKIEKLCNSRHKIRKCNDDGEIVTWTNRRTGIETPIGLANVVQHNIIRATFESGHVTLSQIKKMTL